MRFALAAEGSRGDVQPMVGLAARLVERGHQAVVCAPPDLRRLVEERGLEFRPLGTDIHRLPRRERRFAPRRSVRGRAAGEAAVSADPGGAVRSAARAAAGADMIIGAGAQFAGPSVAEARGIPYRSVALLPGVASLRPLPAADAPEPVAAALDESAGVAWLPGLPGPSAAGELNRHRAALGLGPVSDTYRYLITERPLLAADAALAPVPGRPPRGGGSGRLPAPEGRDAPPPKLESFLQAGPPPGVPGLRQHDGLGSRRNHAPVARRRRAGGMQGDPRQGMGRPGRWRPPRFRLRRRPPPPREPLPQGRGGGPPRRRRHHRPR